MSAFSKRLATSAWFLSIATRNAVSPWLVCAVKSAPASTKSRTDSMCPSAAAHINAVVPSIALVSTSAPVVSNSRETSTQSPWAAHIKGRPAIFIRSVNIGTGAE